MQGFRTVPSLAIAIAAIVGCGSADKKPASDQKPAQPVSGDQRGILATVDALQTASRKGDGRGICANLFTPRLVKSVEAAAKRSCAKEVRKNLFAPNAEIAVSRDITVIGDRGRATIREQNGNVSTLALVKQNGQWRIDRVTPQKAG
jgi:hypothetical protein